MAFECVVKFIFGVAFVNGEDLNVFREFGGRAFAAEDGDIKIWVGVKALEDGRAEVASSLKHDVSTVIVIGMAGGRRWRAESGAYSNDDDFLELVCHACC